MAKQNGKKRQATNTAQPTSPNIEINRHPIGDAPYLTFAQAVEGPTPNGGFNMGGRVIVNGQDTYIEVPPQDDWFEVRSMRGVQKVFLRFKCTGIETVHYGPYDTKEEAALGLHRILHNAHDALMNCA